MRKNAAISTPIWKTLNDNSNINDMVKNAISSVFLALLLCYSLTVVAQEPIEEVTTTASPFCGADTCANAQVHVSYDSYQFGIVLNAGDSELAPYYISSNQGGCITQ